MNKFIAMLIMLIAINGTYVLATEPTMPDLVLGQQDFVHNDTGPVNATTLNHPVSVAVDTLRDRVFVSDQNNHRVLWWNGVSSLVNGKAADGVIGQHDLTSNNHEQSQTTFILPSGICVDTDGKLWVADYYNHRVLRFGTTFYSGMPADLVLGATDYNCGYQCYDANPYQLFGPAAISFDQEGNMWIVDQGFDRIVRFPKPFAIGEKADLVIGKSGFSTAWSPRMNSLVTAKYKSGSTCNPDNYHLYTPSGASFDLEGNLWVADTADCRVVRFSKPFSSGQKADLVLGNDNFTSINHNACHASDIPYPSSVYVDSMGNVWAVNDYRILRFRGPFTNDMNADFVLGQEDFSGACLNRGGNVSASTLNYPSGMTIDGYGNIWIADSDNNRVVRYKVIQSTANIASTQDAIVTLKYKSLEFTLEVPASTFSEDVHLSLSIPIFALSNPLTNLKFANIAVQIANDKMIQPSKDMRLTVGYSNSDVVGCDTSKFVIYSSVSGVGRWSEMLTQLYPTENKLVGTVRNLGIFGVFQYSPQAVLNNAIAYPNPYKPHSGTIYDNTTIGDGIVFGGISANAKIKIFTISGELIRELNESNGNGRSLWDTRNDKGELVASGVYLYLITNPDDGSQKSKGKVAIIR